MEDARAVLEQPEFDRREKHTSILIAIMLGFTLLGLIFFAPSGTAADQAGAGISLSYISNATDQGGQPIVITALTSGFTPSRLTWLANNIIVGNGSTYVLEPVAAGKYNITVEAVSTQGTTYYASAILTVNPPLVIQALNVPQSTSSSSVSASVSVAGGTLPFKYIWTLNQQTQLGCANTSQCLLNLTKQGTNNVTVSVVDAANSMVTSQVAHILYQPGSSSANNMLLYVGAGGGAVAGLGVLYFTALRKRTVKQTATPTVTLRERSDFDNYKAERVESPKVAQQQAYTPGQGTTQKLTEVIASTSVAERKEPLLSATANTKKAEEARIYQSKKNFSQEAIAGGARDNTSEIADWVIRTIKGEGTWRAGKPLPKSELETEFKKRFPNMTIANLNSVVYDLIYKDLLVSELQDGKVILKLPENQKS